MWKSERVNEKLVREVRLEYRAQKVHQSVQNETVVGLTNRQIEHL